MQDQDRSRDDSSEGPQSDNRLAQPPIEPAAANHFVVFADMLGFAALTEAYPIDLRALRTSGRLGSPEFIDNVFGPKNPLTDAFTRFHLYVKSGIEIAEISHAVTAISFSDSVFFASTSLDAAAGFAANLAYSMLSSRVPVRIGLASGSFAALRFRSDVSTDRGDHAAQFLGTAVVRAYRAEKCGIKGMRVLVHPSMDPLLVNSHPNGSPASSAGSRCFRFLGVPSTERKNATGVHYELDYWDLSPTKERAAWHALQDMWEAAPDLAREHYEATADAINRMRVAQGECPLTSFRRRTLPRRPR